MKNYQQGKHLFSINIQHNASKHIRSRNKKLTQS